MQDKCKRENVITKVTLATLAGGFFMTSIRFYAHSHPLKVKTKNIETKQGICSKVIIKKEQIQLTFF